MIELGALLFARLTTGAAVTALVQDRIYPIEYPQDRPLPGCTYAIESAPPERGGSAPLYRVGFSIACYAADLAAAESLAAAVAARLNGWQSIGALGCNVLSCNLANYGPGRSADLDLWLVTLDYESLIVLT